MIKFIRGDETNIHYFKITMSHILTVTEGQLVTDDISQANVKLELQTTSFQKMPHL